MPKCAKCGGKTSRKAPGVFSCRRHGIQPGQAGYDRAGYPSRNPTETTADDGAPTDYVLKSLSTRGVPSIYSKDRDQ